MLKDTRSSRSRRLGVVALRRVVTACSALALLLTAPILSAQPGGDTPRPAVSVPAARAAKNVAVITIEGEITSVTAESVERRLKLAQKGGADAVVIELNTPGGELGAVLEICNLIKQFPIVNTVAWINPDAYSGGSIIALACREIVTNDPGTMGDSLIISSIMGMLNELPEHERQKMLSPLMAEIIDSARRNGHDELLVQGFITLGVELWLVENTQSGRRLFVSEREYRLLFSGEPPRPTPRLISAPSKEPRPQRPMPAGPDTSGDPTRFQPAVGGLDEIANEISMSQSLPTERPMLTQASRGEWKLVEYVTDGNGPIVMKAPDLLRYRLAQTTVKNDEQLLAYFGGENLRRLDASWGESLAARVTFLTWAPIRGVLLLVFLVGAFLEMSSPGIGLPGALAGAALVALLLPAALVGLASWWEIAAIGLGILLIILELFVIPGFGIAGVVGLLLLVAGLIGTFAPQGAGGLFPDSPSGQQDLLWGAVTVLLAIVTAVAILYPISKNLESMPFFQKLILTGASGVASAPENDAGMLAAMAPAPVAAARVGDIGKAVTPLRPSGRVMINDRMIDAVSEMGYIGSGRQVRVIEADRFRVVVEPTENPAPSEEHTA